MDKPKKGKVAGVGREDCEENTACFLSFVDETMHVLAPKHFANANPAIFLSFFRVLLPISSPLHPVPMKDAF